MEEIRVPIADGAGTIVQTRFQEFLQSYHGNSMLEEQSFDNMPTQQRLLLDYMAQIDTMIQNNKSTLFVDFQHIMQSDHELAEAIELEYYRFEPFIRYALKNIVAVENQNYIFDVDKGQREFFVSFYNMSRVERIRAMTSDKVGRLISISGTVTRSSEVRPELLYGSFICKHCGSDHQNVEQQFQYTEPQVCKNPQCVKGDFQLVLDKCAFVDWQRLRVQENADEIPPGSMPRCIDVICRNEVVECAKAGDKVILCGAVTVLPETGGASRVGEVAMGGKSGGRGDNNFGDGVGGLKALGVREMTYKLMFMSCSVQHTDQRTGSALSATIMNWGDVDNERDMDEQILENLSDFEKQEILTMRNTAHLYYKMTESMCPSVFGHLEVKRGILLMLFGGVHKRTKEGISLRGDLNVCIVGDPSCAKSQFLKYVHGFLPRTVYTSGKSSSAAGLTASVVRDGDTGEFCVEAGALMLADNGICCIDEFDKMEDTDQVALHEAMEQQTISITKAGIQATLNARTSILAAANPVHGRYDRSKTLKANVAVSAAIMSRFDLFFVILDECNPVTDEAIARHIINVHKKDGVNKVSTEVPFTRDQLQRYIQFARTMNPVIKKTSKSVLVDCYRKLRSNDILGKNKTAYRITVRQLESLVRLSEALARLHLDDDVLPVYVREAFRLLQKSIIFIETEDIVLEENEEEMEEQMKQSRKRTRRDDEEDEGEGQGEDDGGDDEDDGEGAEESKFEREARRETRKESSPRPDTEEVYRAEEAVEEAIINAGVRSEEGTAMSRGTAADAADSKAAVLPTLPPPAAKKVKAKTHITSKEYDDITQLLILRVKNLEALDDQSDTYKGVRWGDLLSYYLEQFSDTLRSEELFDAKKKVVNQVIRRMIKHEGSLVEYYDVTAPEGGQKVSTEEKLLRLNPSRI